MHSGEVFGGSQSCFWGLKAAFGAPLKTNKARRTFENLTLMDPQANAVALSVGRLEGLIIQVVLQAEYVALPGHSIFSAELSPLRRLWL